MTRDQLMQAVRTFAGHALQAFDASATLDQLKAAIIQHQADPDGPRPAQTYITVQILTSTSTGVLARTTDTDEGSGKLRTLDARRQASVSFSAYGSACHDWLETIRTARHRENIRELLGTLNLAVLDAPPVTDTTALRDTRFEPQANLTMTIAYQHDTTEEVGVVETIQTVGADPGDFADLDFTVTEP